MKKPAFFIILLFSAVFCFAQNSFSRGEELFMHNQPAQAVTFLEIAVAEENTNVKAWLYLGIVYEQLNRMEEAIAVYRRVLPIAGNLSANVANNLGNVYFKRQDSQMAEQFYTQALAFDSVYSSAYLGRANTRILAGDLNGAISDYEQYITLEPRSPQRANIEQLVSVIRAEFAAEELRKIMAEEEERRLAVERQRQEEERQRLYEEEQRRIAIERQRQEEERQRLEEERQRLLESVSATLQSVADSSQALSSGAEGVEFYEGEFELD